MELPIRGLAIGILYYAIYYGTLAVWSAIFIKQGVKLCQGLK